MNKVALFIGSASFLAVVMGGIYIVDCRRLATGAAEVNSCYLTGLPLMGIGGAGAGGFRAGYNTLNPALRKPEEGP